MAKLCQNPLCKKELPAGKGNKKFCNEECRKKKDKIYLYVDENGSLPTILVDTREQMPYTFRSSERCAGFETAALPYGDYTIKGRIDLVVVERKNSIEEIYSNLFTNFERFERELEKMQASKFRYIVVEDYYSSVFSNRFTKIKGSTILDRMLSTSMKFNVPIILAGTREYGHSITRSLLLLAVKNENRGTVPDAKSV